MRRQRYPGVTITEYGLIAVLIAGISISALMLVGSNVSAVFQGMLQTQDTPASGLHVTASSGNQTPSQPALTNPGMASIAGNMLSAQIPLAGGGQLQLTQYPADLPKSVVTLGANGTTELILANLRKVAKQLQDSGQLTPEQASQLDNLANKGHELAELEKLVEDLYFQSGNDQVKFTQTPVKYNGKQIYVDELASQLGAAYDSSTGTIVPGRGSLLEEFWDMKTQIESAGIVKDPAAAQTIATMTRQIAEIANSMETGVRNHQQDTSGPMQNFYQDAISSFQNEPLGDEVLPIAMGTASGQTHGSSAVICTTGGSTDSGTVCR